MSFQLVSLRRGRENREWTQQELAEFYRVESVLAAAGIPVELDRGISDEGDPWFVFCRPNGGDVVIHFARMEGVYIAASGAFGNVLKGRNFRELVDAFIARQPLLMPNSTKSDTVVLHPSALLSALVATALLLLSHDDANAASPPSDHTAPAESHKTGTFRDLVTLLIEPLPPHEQREAILTIGAIVAGMTAITFEVAREATSIGASFTSSLNETVRQFDALITDEWHLDGVPVAVNNDHLNGQTSAAAGDFEVQGELDPKQFIVALADGTHDGLSHLVTAPTDGTNAILFLPASSTDMAGSGLANLVMVGRNAPLREITPSRAAQIESQDSAKPALDHAAPTSGDAASTVAQGHDHVDAPAQESIAIALAKIAGGMPATHAAMIDVGSVPELLQIDLSKLASTPNTDPVAREGSAPSQTSVDFTNHLASLAADNSAQGVGEHLTETEEKAIAAINFFAKSNPDFKVAQMGRDMILFDFEARPDHQINYDVHSWALPDGSKITIIGLIPDQFLA